MWARTIDCLGIGVRIECELDAIAPMLSAVCQSYDDWSGAPAVQYRLHEGRWPTLTRDGGVVRECDTDVDLVAAMELDLYEQVTARAPGLVLHAAGVVGRAPRALVFAGVSGAGKSTLLDALLAHGFRCLSEECVAVDADGTAIGLARPFHAADSGRVLPHGFTSAPYVMSTANGIQISRLFHPPQAVICRERVEVAAIVHISHRPSAPDTFARLTNGEALAALWPTILRQDLETATTTISRIPVFALRTTTPHHALRLALTMAQELGIHAP